MAGTETDRGELLTKFEEIYGTLVEHEVIKMVLQSCDWNSSRASEMILGMIDPDDLPPHIRTAVMTESIISPSRNSRGPSIDRSPSRSPNRVVTPTDSLTPTDEWSYVEEVLQSGRREGSNSPSLSNSVNVQNNSERINTPLNRSYSQSSTLTPFAMAQGTIATEPFLSSDLRPTLLRDEEKETVDVLPKLVKNLSISESNGLPSSAFPTLQPSAPTMGFDTLRAKDSDKWILAPEFVPNALRGSQPSTNWAPMSVGPNYNSTSVNPEYSTPPRNFGVSDVRNIAGNLSKKDEIISKILSGTSMMVLMRGLPGSGKSTLAKEIKGHAGVVLSTDDYFCDKYGRYIYDPNKISEAHAWNKNRARLRLREKRSPIIIDNTNLQIWEMKPYVKLALQNGYEVDILEPETTFKLNPKELAKRTVHGVPKEKIKEMKDRYDSRVGIEQVIKAVGDPYFDPRQNGDQNLNGFIERQSPVREQMKKRSPVRESGNDSFVTVEKSMLDYPVYDDSTLPLSPLKSSQGGESASHNICATNSSLSYLKDYGEMDPDDNADVIIEGYEELDASGAVTNSFVSGGVIQKASIELPINITKKKEVVDIGNSSSNIESIEVLSTGIETECKEESEISCLENCDTLAKTLAKGTSQFSGTSKDTVERVKNEEVPDEERIRKLVEEANMDDENNTDEWDNLISDGNDDELNDEKFNELVNDLGSSVKFELDKKCQRGINVGNSHINEDQDYSEDSAMYDFCNTMEDKLGKPLSSLITKPSGTEEPNSSLFSIINIDSVPPVLKLTSEKSDGKRLADSSQSSTKIKEISEIIKKKNNSSGVDLNSNTHNNLPENRKDSNYTINPDSCTDGIYTEDEIFRSDDEDELDKVILMSGEAKPVSNDVRESSSIDVKLSVNSSSIPKFENASLLNQNSLSLTSWECIDDKGEDGSKSWDSSDKDATKIDSDSSKPTRGNRRRPNGDPQKWMSCNGDATINDDDKCAWEPVEDGVAASWDSSAQEKKADNLENTRKLQSHTGAVPKTRKTVPVVSKVVPVFKEASPSRNGKATFLTQDASISSMKNLDQDSKYASKPMPIIHKLQTDNQTQTLSIDFQALEMDNNLYEMKIIYGQTNYTPECNDEGMLLENGPLTKGKLALDKGTMTEDQPEEPCAKPLRNLIRFFPNIAEAELRDVLEKCQFDLDWTMNVLLDGGYEMAESIGMDDSQEISEDEIEDMETNVDRNEDSSPILAEVNREAAASISSEERIKKLKQSKQPNDLICKREIEKSFEFSGSVDDRVTRLTGKDFDNLNFNKVKQKKSKKKHSKKKPSAKEVNWEEGEGAQYVTLMMDSLFASQLVSMFGPIGSCGMSGEMAPEDRSVILPLELCHQIHKYWTKTLDGKFNHEAQVLDSLIREDETLARRLQEEEDKNASLNDSSSLDNSEKLFQMDPPTNLKEIMDLEQALLQSQGTKNGNEATLSSHLNLQRLYTEYPHVDREALKQEFVESGCNYQNTVKRISNRYGHEQGAPKTVIAPEMLHHYEQQMVQRAKEMSLKQQELLEAEQLEQQEDIEPDDPQVYRDEAQTHYHQRQEYYRKAQEAHRQGMKAVAAYYANIGKLHSEKLNEANQRASLKILEAVNAKKDANILDLHLLHVPEALSATQAFLVEREQVLTARKINQMQVSLITGRGAHSVGGQARLKPAIKDFLQSKGIMYHEANSGMFLVTLQR